MAQAFGYWVLPALWWSFTLFCVDKREKRKVLINSMTSESDYLFWKSTLMLLMHKIWELMTNIFSLTPMKTSVLTNSRNISSSDRLLLNWQQTWHVQQHGWSGMFFDISCAPVARHHLTVMPAASSRLWALREPLALKSPRDTNCVYMYVCVYVYLHIL